jgi:hypothetical protein
MVEAILGAFGVEAPTSADPTLGDQDALAEAPGLSPKARISLEAAAMFGDQEAARKLGWGKAKAASDTAPAIEVPHSPHPAADMAPQTEAEIPLTPGDPLDPCMECGALLPASEMIPTQIPEGSGLICQECADEASADALEQMREAGREQLARDAAVARAIRAEREATDPYSWTPEQLDAYRAETERLRRETAEIRAATAESARKWAAVRALTVRIARINEILVSFGNVAVETDQKGFTGYGAQYVLDAVNEGLGLDAWRYEILDHQIEKAGDSGKAHRAMVLLQLSIRLDSGEWFCRGPVVGGSVNGDGADALKGAITDAVKKALSHWGIGSRAYRGELKAPEK